MAVSWWHLGAAIANLLCAVFFILGIIGTEKHWFKYESDGVLFTSGTFGGCVEYEDCSPCLFWKDRNSNGTAGLDPLCQFYSTKDYKPPSRWVNGGYVAIFMSVVGLIVALICVVLSFLMFIGILRGMKGSVVIILCVCVLMSLLAWVVFIACVRTSNWKEPHPLTGQEVNLSKKMTVSWSFVMCLLAGIAAVAGIVFTALGKGKGQ